jgi:hypothetical protein
LSRTQCHNCGGYKTFPSPLRRDRTTGEAIEAPKNHGLILFDLILGFPVLGLISLAAFLQGWYLHSALLASVWIVLLITYVVRDSRYQARLRGGIQDCWNYCDLCGYSWYDSDYWDDLRDDRSSSRQPRPPASANLELFAERWQQEEERRKRRLMDLE